MRLMFLTALEVLVFAAALVAYLKRIVATLERIGGHPDSYLAKVAFGVRAIEKETSYLAPEVARLNHSLAALTGKLELVDQRLATAARALTKDKGTSV